MTILDLLFQREIEKKKKVEIQVVRSDIELPLSLVSQAQMPK